MIIGLLLGSFVVLLLSGVPLIFSLGISSILSLMVGDFSFQIIVTRIFEGVNSFSLLAIPFFIFAGQTLNNGGGTDKLINLSRALVGHIRGALALINILASMFFAGISGSASADTAGIGSILIPAMIKDDYPKGYSCVVTATSSCLGPIIPPSVVAIIYGTVAGLPIGKLFIGGILPGLLVTILLMIVAYIMGVKHNHPKKERSSFKEMLIAVKEAIPALIIPIIIVLGIVGGVFTPTEAGVLASAVAWIVGMYVYKKLTLKKTQEILNSTAKTTGKLMFIIGTAYLFSWILSSQNFAQKIINILLSVTSNEHILMLLLVIFLLLVGTLIETVSAILILGPTMVSVAMTLGFNPIHFAVLAGMALTMGATTPPVGVGLFITSSIADVPLTDVYKYLPPFLLALIAALLMVAYIPGLVTWLAI